VPSSVLEIGPFYAPLARGRNVSYLDVLSAEELRARAVEVGGDPDLCPEQIDYVGEIEQVDRLYDAVVSCHSIEHQPDLVGHLRGVAGVLKPGGVYVVVVPDKRYCFDHFMAESTISEVLAAAHERRKIHAVKSVIDHWARATHNDPGNHWLGIHGTFPPEDYHYRLWAGLMAYEEGKSGYIDVHAWYFTPPSFSAICQSLRALNLSPLEVEAVYDTTHNRAEFCAVLRKPVAAS
jgi:SAM-dependent methyltransferase